LFRTIAREGLTVLGRCYYQHTPNPYDQFPVRSYTKKTKLVFQSNRTKTKNPPFTEKRRP
jgi:hypothetical protein